MTDDLMDEPVYTIGLAAQKLGVAVPTLRMYEQAKLVIPYRTPSRRRLYSRNDIERIRVIIDLIRSRGMNLEGIKQLCAINPCWILTDCPPDVHKSCHSYQVGSEPCWVDREKNCVRNDDLECRECEVYKSCVTSLKNPKLFLKKFLRDEE